MVFMLFKFFDIQHIFYIFLSFFGFGFFFFFYTQTYNTLGHWRKASFHGCMDNYTQRHKNIVKSGSCHNRVTLETKLMIHSMFRDRIVPRLLVSSHQAHLNQFD